MYRVHCKSDYPFELTPEEERQILARPSVSIYGNYPRPRSQYTPYLRYPHLDKTPPHLTKAVSFARLNYSTKWLTGLIAKNRDTFVQRIDETFEFREEHLRPNFRTWQRKIQERQDWRFTTILMELTDCNMIWRVIQTLSKINIQGDTLDMGRGYMSQQYLDIFKPKTIRMYMEVENKGKVTKSDIVFPPCCEEIFISVKTIQGLRATIKSLVSPTSHIKTIATNFPYILEDSTPQVIEIELLDLIETIRFGFNTLRETKSKQKVKINLLRSTTLVDRNLTEADISQGLEYCFSYSTFKKQLPNCRFDSNMTLFIYLEKNQGNPVSVLVHVRIAYQSEPSYYNEIVMKNIEVWEEFLQLLDEFGDSNPRGFFRTMPDDDVSYEAYRKEKGKDKKAYDEIKKRFFSPTTDL